MTDTPERIERDFPGHFIDAANCRFFRTTDVNGWRVSTVGDYHPRLSPTSPVINAILQPGGPGSATPIGYDRLYETMVFPLGGETCDCGCGAPMVATWGQVDFNGYSDRDEAQAGHEEMVEKYASTPHEAVEADDE